MKIDLTGRVALVTGATRGIGRAIAGTLAECGARVAVVGRDQARADAAATEIGNGARGFACDIADLAQVNALIEAVEKAFGSLDILVNNAGLTRDNILLRLKDDDWDAVIDANLELVAAAYDGLIDVDEALGLPAGIERHVTVIPETTTTSLIGATS